MKRIVILGAGFGGVYTALYLLKRLKPQDQVEVMLISKTNYFLFSPMLHEVATGGLNRSNIVQPIREILRHPKFNFVRCTVKEINVRKKMITTDKIDLSYDYLVIALGAENEFYNIPGAKEHTLPLKSLQDAVAIRNHVLDVLEKSSALLKVKKQSPELNFAIVGAGPTGVEMAGELAEFVDQNLRVNYPDLGKYGRKICLMQKGPAIMPFICDHCRRDALKKLAKEKVTVMTNAAVTKVTKDAIEMNGRQKIPATTTIWTSGVKPVTVPTTPTITDARGFFPVNAYLQVKGADQVYALGDCALMINPKDNKPVPALAQAAVKEAKVLAQNILSDMKKRPLKPFIFKQSGLLISVGKRFAVAEIHGVKFKGFFAWWLWRTIYLTKLIGFRNKLAVAYDWTLNLFFPRDTTQI